MCTSGDSSEALLQQVTRSRRGSSGGEEESEGGEGEEEEEGEGGKRKLRYYLKVMSLFEQVSCPLAVVDIAKTAVRHTNKDDPLSVSTGIEIDDLKFFSLSLL